MSVMGNETRMRLKVNHFQFKTLTYKRCYTILMTKVFAVEVTNSDFKIGGTIGSGETLTLKSS